MRYMFILVIVFCFVNGCVDSPDNKMCGGVPPEPYWEYTEIGGSPAQAKIPLHLWLADLEWRGKMRLWVECMTQ